MSSSRNLDQGCRDLDRVGAAGDSVVAKDATTACSGIGRGAVTGQYKAYPEYRESGVEWLGKVPSHWGMLKLKRIASLLTDKANRRDYPVALENIESWTGRFILTEGDYSGEGVAFEAGDILFGKLRPYLAKVLLTEQPGEAVGDFLVLRPTGLAAAYLHRLLLTREMISLIEGSTYGAKMPRASWDFMGTIEAPIPPAQEQSTIAAFLDHETAKIDRLIAKQEELIALLKEKRQAVISHAVTKGLNPDAPMKDSGVEWLGEIPAHWEVVQMRRALKSIEQGWSPEAINSPCQVDEAGVLKLSAVKQGAFVECENKALPSNVAADPKLFVRDGDLLVTRANTPDLVGDACCVRRIGNRKLMLCDLIYRLGLDSFVNPEFICYWLISKPGRIQIEMDARGSSMSMVKISQEHIKSWLTPLPPLGEQDAITKSLDSKTTGILEAINKAQESLVLLKDRRTALISAAVTGKIDVRGWTPEGEAHAR